MLPRLLGIAVGEQFHRALEVGEQYRDLLALAFQDAFRHADLLGQMRRRVGLGGEQRPPELAAAGAGGVRRWPHSGQNLADGAGSKPQAGQRARNSCPHSSQNLAVALFSCWHCGHCMRRLLITGCCAGIPRPRRPPACCPYFTTTTRCLPAQSLTLCASGGHILI